MRFDDPALAAFLEDQLPTGWELDLDLHPADEMLAFSQEISGGAPGLGLVEYFRAGWMAHRTLARLLAWRFGSVASTPSLLDFASGFGRTTRFLVRELAPERITVAEIKADAVAYQQDRFGVRGWVTTTRPESLATGERFAVIFVASLFTHLPGHRFEEWLRALLDCLEPGGLLVFSVLGPGALPAGWEMPASGLRFESFSESGVLDASEYGTTWVSEARVREMLERFGVREAQLIPRGLWHLQDLWVAEASGGSGLTGLPGQRGPLAFLEQAELQREGALRLTGWCGDPDSDLRPAVEARIGERPSVRQEGLFPRPETAALIGRPGSQFDLRLEPGDAPFRADEVVLLTTRAAAGEEMVAFCGRLESAILWARGTTEGARGAGLERRSAELEQECNRLQELIDWMRASRFWKAREAWWRVRGG